MSLVGGFSCGPSPHLYTAHFQPPGHRSCFSDLSTQCLPLYYHQSQTLEQASTAARIRRLRTLAIGKKSPERRPGPFPGNGTSARKVQRSYIVSGGTYEDQMPTQCVPDPSTVCSEIDGHSQIADLSLAVLFLAFREVTKRINTPSAPGIKPLPCVTRLVHSCTSALNMERAKTRYRRSTVIDRADVKTTQGWCINRIKKHPFV